MIERSGIYMMEQDARLRLKSILGKLREAHSIGKETKSEDDSSSIEHHIQNIFKVGGGIWNESCAKDYIEDLEAYVGKETKAYRHFAF
jgi:hypothetical protein